MPKRYRTDMILGHKKLTITTYIGPDLVAKYNKTVIFVRDGGSVDLFDQLTDDYIGTISNETYQKMIKE